MKIININANNGNTGIIDNEIIKAANVNIAFNIEPIKHTIELNLL